ncbi:MAG TPA: HPr family phosphocarrier protein [Bacillota bacterium]|nr:HPr family phosphocarrier protein [Bacillota bacterium]
MILVNVQVMNELGLHARPISKLTRFASAYEGTISLIKDGKPYDAGNVLDLITLNAKHGDRLEVKIEGKDEAVTAEEITKLFNTKFGEL